MVRHLPAESHEGHEEEGSDESREGHEEKAREWGLFISSSIKEAESDIFAEPGLFWVTAEGTIYLVDVANMPFARPDLEILIPKAGFASANGYPARGTKG